MREPWFGYGWNQVSLAQFGVAADFPAIGEWASHSHNLLLDLIIYNGLPLGLLICAALTIWFTRRIAVCRNAESWCMLMMVFAILTHALLEYPLHYSFYLLPTGLLMGIIWAYERTAQESRRSSRFSLALPSISLTILCGASAAEYVEAEESLRDLSLASLRIGQAVSETPRADWYFVDGWAAYHRAVATTAKAGMPTEQLENLRKVATRYQYPNVLERYAQASALNGEPALTRHVLLHTCKVHSAAICAGMQRRWTLFQAEHPAIQDIIFPVASI